MAEWVKFEKSTWGLSRAVTFFNKISFYAGQTDHWGLGFDFNFYDRSFTIEILNLYFGVEIYRSER